MNYNQTAPTCFVNVLGTNYGIYLDIPEHDDKLLAGCLGYCDKSAKRIVIVAEPDDSEMADWTAMRKESLRHEIVHAFMHESGIDANCSFDILGEEHPEHLVAWIAIQFPKLLKAFNEVGAL